MRAQDQEWLDRLQAAHAESVELLKQWRDLDEASGDRQAVRAVYRQYADSRMGPLEEVAYLLLKIRAELDPLLEAHPLDDINPLLEPDKYEPAAKNKFQLAMELFNMCDNLETELDIIRGALSSGFSQDYLPSLARACMRIGARLMLVDLLTGRKDRWETQICFETGGLKTVSTMESLQKALHGHQQSKRRQTRAKDASAELIQSVQARARDLKRKHGWSANRIKDKLMECSDVRKSGKNGITVYGWIRRALKDMN